MKRRRKKQTTVRLEPETFSVVEEESQASGISRAEVVRRLVNKALMELSTSSANPEGQSCVRVNQQNTRTHK